jgi:hypothetical protein
VTKEVLDEFGRLLMEQRDTAILHHEWAVDGTSRAVGYDERHAALERMTDDDRATVMREVIHAVDETIHHILWMFERHDVLGFDVVYHETGVEAQSSPMSVSDMSDGLGAEPFTEDGWITAYSRYEDLVGQEVRRSF